MMSHQRQLFLVQLQYKKESHSGAAVSGDRQDFPLSQMYKIQADYRAHT